MGWHYSTRLVESLLALLHLFDQIKHLLKLLGLLLHVDGQDW